MEVAAGIIAVIQLADRIVSLCRTYFDARKDIEKSIAEVTSFQDVLKQADEMAKNNALGLYSHSFVNQLAELISGCRSTLEELERTLQLATIKQGRMQKFMSLVGIRTSTLKTPFESKEVTSIIEALNRHKGTITLVLNLDQRSDSG